MEREINARRRIKFSLSDPGASEENWLLFDSRGQLLERRGEELNKPGLESLLSSMAKTAQMISGKEERTIQWEGETISLSVLRYIHMTMGELFDLRARISPDREAFVDCSQKRCMTYREAEEESDAVAEILISMGLEKGDKAAVIMDNCWQNLITKLAIEKIGAVIVNLNIHEKAQMLGELLEETDAKMVFLRKGVKDRDHMELLYEICPELRSQKPEGIHCGKFPHLRYLISAGAGELPGCALSFEALLEQGRGMDRMQLEERKSQVCPFDDATIIHTSGTSGRPKGVVLTHSQIVESICCHVKEMGLREEDRFYMSSPVFHALGSIGSAMTSIAAGCTLVFCGLKGCRGLLEILKKEVCTVISGVPTMYLQLLDQARERPGTAKELKLRLCVTAGAACPVQVYQGLFEELGVGQVLTMYGMTEAGPGIAGLMMESAQQARSQEGLKLWPGVQVQIRDLNSQKPAEPQTQGEIWIKSYGVMREYYKNPQETKKAVDAQGWLHSGDLGWMSREGRLYLTGRCKDLIIRGGENISPSEVEAFLRSNEAVEDVAVVGAPDSRYGEKIVAFVCMKQGRQMSQNDLIDWCRGKIATIKIPEVVVFLERLPLNASGKTDKKELKRRAATVGESPNRQT